MIIEACQIQSKSFAIAAQTSVDGNVAVEEQSGKKSCTLLIILLEMLLLVVAVAVVAVVSLPRGFVQHINHSAFAAERNRKILNAQGFWLKKAN